VHRRLVVLATYVGSALLGVTGAAPSARQDPSRQQTPTFHAGVDVVQLDVTVLGKDHLPVRGLALGDFTVKVDGHVQTLAALHEVDLDDPPPPPAAWMRDVTPDVTTNTQQTDRLVVIVVDDALIPLDPFIVRNTKATLDHIIDKLGPSDLTSIVFTADNRRAQDFTHDRAALHAAVTDLAPGFATWTFGTDGGGTVNSDNHYYWSSMKTVRAVAESLEAQSNQRKILIWVGPGIPMNVEDLVPFRGTPPVTRRQMVPGQQPDMNPHVPGPDTVIWQVLNDLYLDAQRANVAIYPVDVGGVDGLETYIRDETFTTLGSNAAIVAHKEARLSIDFLEQTAANTGGHAIVRTNDPAAGVDEIFRENGSYYLLGFTPSNPKQDGASRRLEVTVDRPGVEVHARSHYYAGKPEPAGAAHGARTAETPEAQALATAVGGLLPASELPLGVTLAPFAAPGRLAATVTIAMSVQQPIIASDAQHLTGRTELQISAFTPEGDPRGTQRSTATVRLAPGASGDASYDVLGRIDLVPGRYSLRLAAHDAEAGKTGAVSANLVVPDFAAEALSLSGVVVSRLPATPSAPADLFSDLLPIVPTADRRFERTDRVEAFLRVYQGGGKPPGNVSIAVRIVDGHDGIDVSDTRPLAASAFATPPAAPTGRGSAKADDRPELVLRAADLRYPVPLDRLAPGDYLLVFEATQGGATIQRNIRFSVQ